jgi:hypothetical protein
MANKLSDILASSQVDLSGTFETAVSELGED